MHNTTQLEHNTAQQERNCITIAENALRNCITNAKNEQRNKKQMIMQLRNTILEARATGKPWAEIITILKSAGIEVSEFYLRTCLQIKQQQRNKKTTTKATTTTQNATQKATQTTQTQVDVVDKSKNKIFEDTVQF